jgi:putative ubiquitin-RnfH superfamily antitoxin RatB of RatAB toxin-antitoxin module
VTRIRVTLVWATGAAQEVVTVLLPAGASVADALARAGLVAAYALDPGALGFAIDGRPAPPATILAGGERVDVTEPLVALPKAARRERATAAKSGR